MFGLTQIINLQPRNICSSASSMIQVSKSPQEYSRKMLIKYVYWTTYAIFYTRKINTVKAGVCTKIVNSIQSRIIWLITTKMLLGNFGFFENVNCAYSNFLQRVMTVIRNVPPF